MLGEFTKMDKPKIGQRGWNKFCKSNAMGRYLEFIVVIVHHQFMYQCFQEWQMTKAQGIVRKKWL